MPLPQGTVTFLFTDIEGSTRLLQHLGDRYADLLADQRRLLRAAFDRWHGHELGTEGDSFFVAFPNAPHALEAVVSAQRALASHPWPDGLPVRVRMGLHTGEPTLTPEGYIGLDVHRAARVNACGHGGQILLSQRTCDLVAQALPVGVSLRDLGGHRLKDLLHPEHLFQVVIDGLPADFPPLKSLSAHPNNLPLQLTSFIGREREMEEVKRLLTSTRLLTLTGTGGAGKTRLSLQVAADLVEEYADGVWLVELAALTEGSLVPQTVAGALHLREEPGRTLTETLTDYLRSKETLLVLDNCEHLVQACARLSETLLQSCPRVRVLATSREALGILGEVAWRVPSLPVPDPGRLRGTSTDPVARVIEYAGVRLFVERGSAALPAFTVTRQNATALAEVCHRLDGIPLAIELAAARVKALPVEKIAERLDDRFRLLTGGSRTALPRQQTLRALIDWSYELLLEAERVLLRRLSVFAGGWTLEAAEAVCAGEEIEVWEVLDLLTALVEKSLVLYEEPGAREGSGGRYRLLETIRQYGAEKLQATAEGAGLRARHRDWYVGLAEQAEPELTGPAQKEWLARLEEEHENLRAALAWSKEQREAEAGLRLGGALWRFWEVRGYLGEGREQLARLLALREGATGTAARAKALNGAGVLAFRQADYAEARSLHEENLPIFQELGDRRGIAASLNSLGIVASEQGDYAAARSLYEESLTIRRELGDRRGIADSLNNLGIEAKERGDYVGALSFGEESLTIYRELGDRRRIAMSLDNLGSVAYHQGDYAAARSLYEESLAIRRELGDRQGIAMSLSNLGNVARDQGDYVEARSLQEESLAIRRELGARSGIAMSLNNLGAVAYHQGDYAEARSLHEESLAIRRELGDRQGIATSLHNLGDVASDQGDYAGALLLYEESLTIFRELGDRLGIAGSLEALATLAGAQEQPERAARLFGAAEALREAIGAPLPPSERDEVERGVATAREALGEPWFAAAWAAGRGLSLEQAVTLALGRPSDA